MDFELFLYLNAITVVILACVVYGTSSGVKRLCNPLLEPLTLEQGRSDEPIEGTAYSHEWAKSNDFTFIGYFVLQGALIAAWKHSDQSTFFCQYIVQDICSYDFATEFENHISLTTGSGLETQLFPPQPKHYKQSFSNITLDEQWKRHVEMKNYLIEVGQAKLTRIDRPFNEIFTESIRKQMKFIRSLWLWRFRGAYWFFVRRHLWHNKSIKTQHEKGMIKLPNELFNSHNQRDLTL